MASPSSAANFISDRDEFAVIPNAAFLVGPSCRFRWSRVGDMLTRAVLLVKHSGELLDRISLPPPADGLQAVLIAR